MNTSKVASPKAADGMVLDNVRFHVLPVAIPVFVKGPWLWVTPPGNWPNHREVTVWPSRCPKKCPCRLDCIPL